MSGIESLWEHDVKQARYVTPKRVMQAQANYLTEMSGGKLSVKLTGKQGTGIRSDSCIHEFCIGLAAPFEFEYKLFEVRQTMDIYPLQVVGVEGGFAAECQTLDEFIDALRVILNAAETKRRLNAMYSQACDESADEQNSSPPLMNHDFAERSETTSDTAQPEVTESPAPEPEAAAEPTAESSPAEPGSDQPAPDAATEEITFPGYASVSEINQQVGINLDTSGGDISTWFGMELGARPMPGSRIEAQGYIMEVTEMAGRSVGQIMVYPKPQ